MSDVVENGSSGGAWLVQTGESHDEFFELSALSTTDLLSTQERHRLEEHLRHCMRCQEVHAQYQAIVDAGVPWAIVEGEDRRPRRPASEWWSVEEAEAKLLARLGRVEEQAAQISASPGVIADPAVPTCDSTRIPRPQPVNTRWRQMWWQYAAAAVLVSSLGVSLYRGATRRGEEMGASAPPPELVVVPVAGKLNERKTRAPADTSLAPGRAEAAEVAALRTQLDSKKEEVERLEYEKANLEQRLLAAQNEHDELAENAELERKLEASVADLATARRQLAATQSQDSQDAARLAALEQQIEEFKSNAEEKDQEVAREQEMLERDRDIRELMGSRKLYIAEVYDVAKTGETQRSFGRVFYTKGKSLIFYAYGLDQQSGIRETGSFQAWGRKGPDTAHAVNLGIFYADITANKRWILKSDDPEMLSDIDAVFVTVEPQGGSNHPSGKPLLFAYLRVEPNHP